MITDIVLIVWSKREKDNEKWYHYRKKGFQANNIIHSYIFPIYLHQEIRVTFKTK